MQHNRRNIVGFFLLVPLLALALTFSGAWRPAAAQQPITLSLIDVAGDLNSVRVILDNYKNAFPNKVKEILIQRAPANELPAKIKAQQDAGRLDINLILTGQDGASQMIAAGQLIKLFPTYEKLFPREELTEQGKTALDGAEGYAVPSVVSNGGPIFSYNPDRVPNPPKTADELLAWAKANPGRFIYARPANSGPGRSIVRGLPFILKDKDPNDPEKGWDKTWAFFKELGKYIEYYPAATSLTQKSFSQGEHWMIVNIMEADMAPRAGGMIPPDTKITILENTTFVIDCHYWAIPKGVPQNQIDVILDVMKFMRRVDQQVLTWKGFIGPSIKAATLDKAPPDIQKYVKEYWRPEYDQIGTKWKVTSQLPAAKLAYALDRWDREVGGPQIRK